VNSEEIVARLTPDIEWWGLGKEGEYQAVVYISDQSVRLYRYSSKNGWVVIDRYKRVLGFRPFTWKYLD
jgi:hypothetical protein